MPAQIITLTGAPRPSTLRWDDSELLDDCWFCRLRTTSPNFSTADSVRWRVIPPREDAYSFPEDEEEEEEGNNGGYGDADFFALGAIERYSGVQATMDMEFYDHSFAAHEGNSTVLSGMESYYTESSELETTLEETSMISLGQQSATDDENNQHALPPAIMGQLSDIKDIPNATYLRSIAPRMIPLNLIVAIITIHRRRRVRTRWGNEMDIVEVVVGDETKSGFGITCWLSVDMKDKEPDLQSRGGALQQGQLNESVGGLRPRDIVLFRSVALNTFRGQVYGQSVKDNRTKIDLLHRTPVDLNDSEGLFTARMLADQAHDAHPQLVKVRRVRNWILNFISPQTYGNVEQPSSLMLNRPGPQAVPFLPPDTQ
ncbi:hypothetical protein FQN55_002512 [Onygenales sp. PD_40]|nr:hypothetical protein FQN55_002512 [Onygenales sp. PD_40]KAK2792088.1 hypothetical protein FQN51_001926 [Onygenales sp. PD_10]